MAYLMATRRLRMEEAYEFVKTRRRIVSPNFNFMGQLLSFEAQIFASESASPGSEGYSSAAVSSSHATAAGTSLDNSSACAASMGSSDPSSNSLKIPRNIFDFSQARGGHQAQMEAAASAAVPSVEESQGSPIKSAKTSHLLASPT